MDKLTRMKEIFQLLRTTNELKDKARELMNEFIETKHEPLLVEAQRLLEEAKLLNNECTEKLNNWKEENETDA